MQETVKRLLLATVSPPEQARMQSCFVQKHCRLREHCRSLVASEGKKKEDQPNVAKNQRRCVTVGQVSPKRKVSARGKEKQGSARIMVSQVPKKMSKFRVR